MKIDRIIIEGCDGTGKTTIANQLARIYHPRFRIIHVGPPKGKNNVTKYHDAINHYNSLTNEKNVIFDRFMIGECIYGPLKRGYYPYWIRKLEEKIRFNTILIILNASEELVKKRYDGDFITEDEIFFVLNGYRNEFTLSTIEHKMLIDVEKPGSIEFMFLEIKRLLKDENNTNYC